jgi:hypothetical protein
MKEESFIKGLFLVGTFLFLTPIALATSIFALLTVSYPAGEVKGLKTESAENVRILSSAASYSPSLTINTTSGDARVEIVRQYLEGYSSPLTNHAKFIVETSDKYGVDFRLTTAIAQQESNLCKKIPADSYNCWGWGIHSRGSLGFRSFEEGIESVTKGIREDYIDQGLLTAEEIMAKYTPLSQGTWAEGVNTFMEEME